MASDLVFVCARKQKKISWSMREGQRLEQALMNFLTVPNEIQNRMNEYILKKWTEWNKKKKSKWNWLCIPISLYECAFYGFWSWIASKTFFENSILEKDGTKDGVEIGDWKSKL